jgi:hypothetical protein
MPILAPGNLPPRIAFQVFLADTASVSLYSCSLSILYLNFNLFILSQTYDGFIYSFAKSFPILVFNSCLYFALIAAFLYSKKCLFLAPLLEFRSVLLRPLQFQWTKLTSWFPLNFVVVLLVKNYGFAQMSYHSSSVPGAYHWIYYRHQYVLDLFLRLKWSPTRPKLSLTLSGLLSRSISLHCLDSVQIFKSCCYSRPSSIAFSSGSIQSVGSGIYCFHLSLLSDFFRLIGVLRRKFLILYSTYIRRHLKGRQGSTPGLWPFFNSFPCFQKSDISMSHDFVDFLLFFSYWVSLAVCCDYDCNLGILIRDPSRFISSHEKHSFVQNLLMWPTSPHFNTAAQLQQK